MDAIDRKILTVLQADANISIAELADRVGLSQTLAGSASRSWNRPA